MQRSIYPQRSQTERDFFSREYLHLGRDILIVPLDYAKDEHTVQMCFLDGQYLFKKPMRIFNTLLGVDYLEKRLKKACKRNNIDLSKVIIGCEDPPSYVSNFIDELKKRSFRVVRVNAAEASNLRTNNRASSDSLDLNGIAQAIIHRRSRDIIVADEIYSNLKSAVRTRRKLIKYETLLKNQIHQKIDILFPGFLKESNTGLTAFSQAHFWLMKENFSCIRIQRMRLQTLVKGLKKHRVKNAELTAKKLKLMASEALPPNPQIIRYHSDSLRSKITLMQSLQENIKTEENEMARLLIQTPGFFLTSIPGMGIVLTAGIVGELGHVDNWLHADKMASYAGIVAREKQTGGFGKPVIKGSLPYACNHILKDYLLQAAFQVGIASHPFRKIQPDMACHRLQFHNQKIENNGGRNRLSTAKLLLRIARKMVTDQTIYMPHSWLNNTQAPSQEIYQNYLENVSNTVSEKFKKYQLEGIPEEKNYLKIWLKTKDAILETNNTLREAK